MLKTKDGYAKVIGTSYQGSSDYLLLSNGDSKAISSLSVNYATSAGNADTLDGVHLNGIFTAFQANSNTTRLVIGGVTKDLTIPYASQSPFLYKNSTFNSTGQAGLQYYDGDMSNTTNNNSWSVPSSGWHQILHLPLSVSGYFTELSFPVNDVNGLAWRQRRSNSYYGWYRILDSNNYSSYIKKIGTSTVGSSSIPIYLNAGTPTQCSTTLGVSITGNAATATILKTTRTLWGQSFNGSNNVSGSLSNTGTITASAAGTYDIGSSSLDFRYGYFQWIGAKANTNLRLAANNSDNQIVLHTNGNVGIGTNAPAYKLHVNGAFRATNSTVSDLFVNTGDATLKIYTGRTTDAQNDGNICFQTSIDATDGQSHAYPTQYQSRCNIVLQPRGGQVYIGTNPSTGNTTYKLYVNSKIFSNGGFVKNGSSDSYVLLGGGGHKVLSDFAMASNYVKKSGDTMSGVLTIDTTNFGALIIQRNDDANGASIQFRGKSNVYGYIGLNNSTKDKQFLRWGSDTSKTYTILDTSSTYTSNGKGIINGTTITQVDNATSSGNADTVDGVHVKWVGAIAETEWLAAWENYNTIRCIAPANVSVGNADKVDGYHASGLFRDLGWWGSSETHDANDISGNGAVFAYSTHSNVPVTGVLTTFSGKYDSYNWQMSKAYTNRALYIRQRNGDNGTWSDWVRLLDENDLVWDNIAGKPSTFNPTAHTHTVFNNNLMIKGTNGISNSASIHLGIGDSDTGFKWISDGKCQIYANNTAVGEWTSGGMNWFKNPTVNGNKVWNAGNDGSGSGLDADTVDGVHANQLRRIYTFNVHNSIIKVGTLTSGQAGHVCKLRFNSGISYNAANTDKTMTVVIRASNGGANSNGFYFEAHSESYRGGAFTTFYLHQTSKTQCELYMAAFNYSGQSIYEISFSNGDSWTNEISVQNALPISNIFTLPNYQIAYTDYNVASATKLATARTIWGQSFDGTTNISGTLSGVAHIQFSADNTYDIGSDSAASRYIYTYWLGAKSGQKLELGANNSSFGQGLCIDTNLNVGIGTNTPTYKLDVKGDIRATGQIIRNGSSQGWVNGRKGALLRETTSTGYHTLWSLKTTNGSWDFGEYNSSGWNNIPVLSYITDTNFNSGNNTTTYQIKFPLDSGTIALTKNIPTSLPANGGNADTVDGYHANGLLTALSNTNNGISITVGGTTKSISNISVNYANSAGNADTLDGLNSTKFLRQVVVPNNTENDFNTFSNMTLTGRVDPTTGASLKNAPWSGSGPGGGYGVLTYLFNGYDYGTQMAWEYGSNRIYIRNRHWVSGVGLAWRTSWDKLALTTDIPSSLKNPYALTLKANGTILATYDGSSAKEANFTYANVGAAPASHTHTAIVAEDLRSKYPGQILDPQRMKLSFLAASTLGIKNDGSYYDVITVRSYRDSTGGSDNALLFSKNSNSLYHTRFTFGSTSSWGSPLLIIDSGNIGSQSVAYASKAGNADTTDGVHIDWSTDYTAGNYLAIWDNAGNCIRPIPKGSTSVGYASKAGSVAWDSITGKPSSFTPSSHTHSWTSITDKLVAGNEFNIVNAGFNSRIWVNYLPINDRSKTATISDYGFGNGHQGYATVTASGFVKSGSSSSYVLLGDGGHQTISSLSVNHASFADYIRSNALPTPANNTVKAYKDSLAKFFNDIHPNVGVGANVNVSESIISHWSNDSATFYNSSNYCFIKIGGAYAGATYGQFLLSSYNLSKVGIVGRNSNQWSKIKWLAYEDQIPTDNKQLANGAGYITSAGSCAYATSSGNADKVDGYHASNLVKFYLSPMASDASADSAKSWFINTMPSASGAIVYNVPGSEKTIIAGKSSGEFGHMLQLNYDNKYLRILRYYKGSWKSTDWEKISAGYADSAGSVAWSNITDRPSSLKNPYSLNVFGVTYDGSAAKTVTTSTFVSQLSEGTSTVTDGTMFITSWASDSGFADTNAVNVPYKRKASCLWNYIDSKVSSKYLPLAGGTMNGNARIGHGSGNLYIGNSGNDGWIYTQDIASQKGTDKWWVKESGAAHFGDVYICSKNDGTYDSSIIECYTSNLYLNYYSPKGINLCNGGGNVGIGTTSPSYKLDVNGQVRASGFIHSSHNSNDSVLLAGGGYSQGVPVKYWSIEQIIINSSEAVYHQNRGGNYTFITKIESYINGACTLTLQFPSGYDSYNTMIWAMGRTNNSSPSDRANIYATIIYLSGSKYRLVLADDSTLNNGSCHLYFMCF